MDQVQDMRKKEDLMQGGIVIEDPGTQEVLPKLKGIIIHQLIQPRSHMHLKNQRATQKCPLLDIKEEDMNKTICKESLGRLSHQLLMVKKKGRGC
jgi:hypothetical protein